MRRTITLLALLWCFRPQVSSAESPADVARADALFKQGQDLLEAGRNAEACEYLSQSYQLDPKLGRLLNLAYCHETIGKNASAWREYNDAAALAVQRGQKEREEFARQHVEEVAKKLSFIRIEFPKGRDTVAEVTLDSSPLARDRWSLPVPIDPGKHTIVARAPGRVSRTLSFEIAPKPDVTAVNIDALEVDATPQASQPPPQPEERPRASLVPWSLVAAGVAVAGFGVGGLFGGLAVAKKSEAEPTCPMKSCDEIGHRAIEDARTFSTVSTIGLIAGGVALATAVVLFIVSPRAQKHVQAGFTGLGMGGSF